MGFVGKLRRAMPVAFVAVVVAVLAHGAIWLINGEEVTPPDVNGKLESVSFSPYDASQNPEDGDLVTPEQIRADMAVVAPYVKRIRTYAATGGLEHVPEIAAEFGIKVTLGAWIDLDEERNAREIKTAIDLANKFPNTVEAIVVGNETVLRGEKTGAEMAELLRKVRGESPVPITTGDIWSTWLENPEMAGAVDFVAAHMLGYWEGVPRESVVEHAVEAYNRLRTTFPGKHIVVAEFGWPSGGYNMKAAEPGPVAQAEILRAFVSRARDLGIDYNIIEAFDQRWKVNEGSVGAYWGLFDAERNLKFDLAGTITEPNKERIAGAALLVGTLLSLFVFLLKRPTFLQAMVMASAAQCVGAWLAITIAHPLSHYLVVGSAVMWVAGLILLVPLALLSLARIEEIAAVALGRQPARLLAEATPLPDPQPRTVPLVPDVPSVAAAPYLPKVSIHIPAYREPAEMLKQTLDSVAALDYPNFECVVVVNNTPDPALVLPVEAHCRALGPRFKFINAERVDGFKAGALRLALNETAEDAEIVALLDADYVVQPDWLKDLVPHFADARVGLIQAPQDHRDDARSLFHRVLNAEYAGFFDIGMVQRNESNAIVVHGTMCLIRRVALDEAGGWSSDTITEDTDLGLSILERGWTAHYTRRRYGHGLLPDDYQSFKTQRHRWAYGGLQICRKHWRRLLPNRSRLAGPQRAEYLIGWMNWLGAETLGVAAALLNLMWVPVVAFAGIALPDSVLTLPVVIVFLVNILHFSLLYKLRVRMPMRYAVGAAIAAMSLQLTIARAVTLGLFKDTLPFLRTAKGAKKNAVGAFPAKWEAIIGSLLVAGAALLWFTNSDEVREIYVFALVLIVQSLPFLATVSMALLERRCLRQQAAIDAAAPALTPATVAVETAANA
ncbi:glycosyltransferase [Pseudoxanthobacter sp. M-2]|uniref:glycosyltransferase family 2 protein n=1 Tax=Pseudoxanthobacter sp. M-2 TaxID=3078754 RepID=UPI0038FC8FBA